MELEPGGQAEVAFTLGREELEFFDAESGAWRVAAGRYEILVGHHSRDLSGAGFFVTRPIPAEV